MNDDMSDGISFWQLGDGFPFEVMVLRWPSKRRKRIALIFLNGPDLDCIRCHLLGDPVHMRFHEPDGSWWYDLNILSELPLRPVSRKMTLRFKQSVPLRSYLTGEVASADLPQEGDDFTLGFEVGWLRSGYEPSKDESWTCEPFHFRYSALREPTSETEKKDDFEWPF